MTYFQYDSATLPQIKSFSHQKKDFLIIKHPYFFDYYFLCFITEGELIFEENGIKNTLKKGDMYIFEPYTSYSFSEKTSASFYQIYFTHSKIKKICLTETEFYNSVTKLNYSELNTEKFSCQDTNIIIPQYISFSTPFFYKNINSYFEKSLLYMEKIVPYLSILSACYTTGLFIEVIRTLISNYEPMKSNSILAVSIMNYLNAHYSEPINGKKLEEFFFFSFDHLNHIFSNIYHTSISKTLEKIRIDEAINLLIHTNKKISEIAIKVGFSNEFYFSSVFKKIIGISPSEYRKSRNSTPK